MSKNGHTFPGSPEMALECTESSSLNLVAMCEKVPRKEAREILDCSICLDDCQSAREILTSMATHLVATSGRRPHLEGLRDGGVEHGLSGNG